MSREIIYGGSLEELLRPPIKSVGFRTETQIQLMRKMRFVSNKLNLTQVRNSKAILSVLANLVKAEFLMVFRFKGNHVAK